MKKILILFLLIISSKTFGYYNWWRNGTGKQLKLWVRYRDCETEERTISPYYDGIPDVDTGKGGCCLVGFEVHGDFNNSPYEIGLANDCSLRTCYRFYESFDPDGNRYIGHQNC